MRSVWILIALTIIIGSIIMAIHDVDTTSDGRTSATPLLHDTESTRKADGTQGVTQKVNDDTGPYVSTKDGRVLVNDGTYEVIVLGRQDDGEYSLKVAKSGYNVSSASDDQLIFNSSQNVLKVVKTMDVTLPSFSLNTGGAVWGSFAGINNYSHNLSHVPIVTAYANISGGYWPLPVMFNSVAAGSPYWIKIALAADGSDIIFSSTIIGYNINITYPSVNVKVYLFQESAS